MKLFALLFVGLTISFSTFARDLCSEAREENEDVTIKAYTGTPLLVSPTRSRACHVSYKDQRYTCDIVDANSERAICILGNKREVIPFNTQESRELCAEAKKRREVAVNGSDRSGRSISVEVETQSGLPLSVLSDGSAICKLIYEGSTHTCHTVNYNQSAVVCAYGAQNTIIELKASSSRKQAPRRGNVDR